VTALTSISERAIILAPLGRDGSLALMMLNEAGYGGIVATDLNILCEALAQGSGLLIIAAEALRGADLSPLLERSIQADTHTVAINALRRSMILEFSVAVIIMGLVAWLGTLSPEMEMSAESP